jgi:SAM-dependent methyltransferase
MIEFTGERVLPGQVDADLWNEHVARYSFAARLARAKNVLDAGCGSGYGAAALAEVAHRVIAVDRSGEAVAYARANYAQPNLNFLQASCASLPLPDASIDLAVAFEVIEHLADWREFLLEARRVLAPGGQFIVSTPNKDYYAESRRLSGPNPYHDHEFEYDEFLAELAAVFPHVSMYLQNHAEGIVFRPVFPECAAQVRVESGESGPEHAHFFVAVCALRAQTGAPTFVYLPTTTNILREREMHIAALEGELATKNQWLDQARSEHQELVEKFRQQTAELEERNRWAEQLNQEIEQRCQTIQELMEESVRQKADYEKSVAWARRTQQELTHCAELLDKAEKTVVERTEWAQHLDKEREQLEAMLLGVKASRWVRLGRTFGVGPDLGNS